MDDNSTVREIIKRSVTQEMCVTQEMNPRIAPIQYLRLFQNVTSLEM